MRPVSGPAFERLLRTAEPAVFRQFVADLWAGRGWQTAIDGEVIVATDDSGRTQRILVRHSSDPASAPPAPDVDCVVTDTTDQSVTERVPPHVRVFDAADLRDMLWYGMDRDAADELVRRYFDRPLTSQQEADASISERLRSSPALAIRVLAIAVVVLLLVQALLGGPAGLAVTGNDPPISPTGGDLDGGGSVPTARPAAADLNATVLPPGVDTEGITDTRAVTRATAAALANRSFRWELTRRTTVDGQETEASRRVVTVNRPTVYAVTVRRPNGSESDEAVIEGAYADGRDHLERVVQGGETTYCAHPATSGRAAADSYANRIEQRLGWLLTARTSEFNGTATRNGSVVYQVHLSSDRWSDIEEQTGTVLIDTEGVVVELRTTYTSSRAASRKTIVIEYRLEFEVATVSPPSWYPAARAATDPTTERC